LHAGQLAYLRYMISDEAALLALTGRHIAYLAGRPVPFGYAELRDRGDEDRLAWFLEQITEHGLLPASVVEGFVKRFVADLRACNQMLLDYTTRGPIRADILLLRATGITAPHEGFPSLEIPLREDPDATYGWAALTSGTARVRPMDATHENIVFEPQVGPVADTLRAALVIRARAALQDATAELAAFAGFSAQEWFRLLEQMEPLHLAPGDVLFRDGDESRSFYLVAEGELELLGRRAGGDSHHLTYLGPRTILGEISFIDGLRRAVTVVALSRCHLYELSRDRLQELEKSDPALASAVLGELSRAAAQKLREAVKQLISVRATPESSEG
jgi:CRP-like cAMP-binding protein